MPGPFAFLMSSKRADNDGRRCEGFVTYHKKYLIVLMSFQVMNIEHSLVQRGKLAGYLGCAGLLSISFSQLEVRGFNHIDMKSLSFTVPRKIIP